MKATVNWQNNMVFIGKSASGFPVQMDADPNFGGTESGVRPMEMIALGLAGCTAMDVISILRKKRQDVTQFEVRVDAPRSADHPKVFTKAVITYIATGRSVDEDAVLRSIELAATKYCPAQIMLEYTADRRLTVNHQDIALPDLERRLREIYAPRNDKTIFIAGAASLPYGAIVEVMDAAKGAGVQRLGIITEGMRRSAQD